MALTKADEMELKAELSKQPPLSVLDRLLLVGAALICFASSAGLWVLGLRLQRDVKAAEAGAVAVQMSFSVLWCLPAVFLLFAMGLCALFSITQRYAIFGLPGAVYRGSTRRDILGYPLFMDLREAPEEARTRVKKERRSLLRLAAVLAVFLYLFTWSWQGRLCVYTDGSMRVYSGRGQVTAQYQPEEIDRFTLRISEPYSRQANHELDFMVRFRDGKSYTFQMPDLTSRDAAEYLQWLWELKEIYGPEALRVEDTELLDELIRDQGYEGRTLELLYQLFELP